LPKALIKHLVKESASLRLLRLSTILNSDHGLPPLPAAWVKALLTVPGWSIPLVQSVFFADELALLRVAEISLAAIVINAGVGVDPDHLIALAG
jgi:hypothetical protein